MCQVSSNGPRRKVGRKGECDTFSIYVKIQGRANQTTLRQSHCVGYVSVGASGLSPGIAGKVDHQEGSRGVVLCLVCSFSLPSST